MGGYNINKVKCSLSFIFFEKKLLPKLRNQSPRIILWPSANMYYKSHYILAGYVKERYVIYRYSDKQLKNIIEKVKTKQHGIGKRIH